MKLILHVPTLFAAAAATLGTADAAACVSPYASTLSVTCTAQNGETEDQFPKDTSLATYAAPGTDCNAIQTPVKGHWRECLRTVQFDFDWMYDGEDDATLGGVKRDIANSLGQYPEETASLLEPYWGREIYTGVALTNTYHQIVVDICLEPITYTYKLLVDIEMPDGTTCTNEVEYVYEITANYGETQGYTQFKNKDPTIQSAAPEDDVNPALLEAASEGIEGFADENPTSPANIQKGGLAIIAVAVASLLM